MFLATVFVSTLHSSNGLVVKVSMYIYSPLVMSCLLSVRIDLRGQKYVSDGATWGEVIFIRSRLVYGQDRTGTVTSYHSVLDDILSSL